MTDQATDLVAPTPNVAISCDICGDTTENWPRLQGWAKELTWKLQIRAAVLGWKQIDSKDVCSSCAASFRNQ